MISKIMHISKCNENFILAEDIVNSKGVFVLRNGTSINDYILKKLGEFGIEYITVYEKDLEKSSYINYRIFEKKYNNAANKLKNLAIELVRGRKLDYHEVKDMAEDMISEYEEPYHILDCLRKIRVADDCTYYHSVNVSFYAMLIGGWLNFARNDIKTIIQAGLLHDLGKAKIPNNLLNKKEKLSIKEFEMIKKHSIFGYKMIKDDSEIPEDIKNVILMHHEREDGSGYPAGLSSNELSIYTKIVAVADVYDAMTSARPYKNALIPFDAFEEFYISCRGRLDMHIVNTLLNNLSRYYIGCKVRLNTGQAANIAYIPPQCMWKPIVDIGSEFIDMSTEKDIFIKEMS